MTTPLQGRRQPAGETDLTRWQPGDYGIGAGGHWVGITPNGHAANLRDHQVTENPDGTITVRPSILVQVPRYVAGMPQPAPMTELWHGYLTNGEWRSC